MKKYIRLAGFFCLLLIFVHQAKAQQKSLKHSNLWEKMSLAVQNRHSDSLQLLLLLYEPNDNNADSMENALFYRYKGDYFQMKANADSAEHYYLQSIQHFLFLNRTHEASFVSEKLIGLFNMQQLNSEQIIQKFDSLIPLHYAQFSAEIASTWLGTCVFILINTQKAKEANILLSKGFDRISTSDTLSYITLLSVKAFMRFDLGNYSEAIKMYTEIQTMAEEIKNTEFIFQSVNMMGFIYGYIKDYDQTIEKYKSLLDTTRFNVLQYAHAANNISDAYMNKKMYKEAMEFVLKSKRINEAEHNQRLLYYNMATLAEIHLGLKNYPLARQYADTALAMAPRLMGEGGIAYCKNIFGEIYMGEKKYNDAQKAFDYTQNYLQHFFLPDMAMKLYFNLHLLYEAQNQHQKSMLFLKKYYEVKDSTMSAESISQVNSLNTLLEIERVEKENNQLKTQQQLNHAIIQKQKITQYSMIVGILLILLTLAFFIRGNKIKQKANALLREQKKEIEYKNEMLEKSQEEIKSQNELLFIQNEEIKAQNDEIKTQQEMVVSQNQMLEQKNKEINDSIIYARRIQQAVLPTNERVALFFPKSFVYWKPRNIVSGDFYWVDQYGDNLVLAAADSTGHGVPGAFMSMLGMAFLNEILHTSAELNPADILDRMRKGIKHALNQNDANASQKDGMDIALCIINMQSKILSFAGAYNSAFIMRNKELIELKADKQPVGVYYREKPFTMQNYTLKSQDRIYLYSDGFIDQFGGENGGKYLKNHFSEFIIGIQQNGILEQRELFRQEYHRWTNDKYEQLDDILVLGVEID
jgi:serine phosphatase RsbU (regulator of sigma subunit)